MTPSNSRQRRKPTPHIFVRRLLHLRPCLAFSALTVAGGCGHAPRSLPSPKPISVAAWTKAQPVQQPEETDHIWNPPTSNLPSDFVKAVQFLQRHGLADPRGGQFVKVILRMGLADEGLYTQAPNSYGWLVKRKDGKPCFISEDGLAHLDFSKPRAADIHNFLNVSASAAVSQGMVRSLEENGGILLDSFSYGGSLPSVDPQFSVGALPSLPGAASLTQPRGGEDSTNLLDALFLVDGNPDLAQRELGRNRNAHAPYLPQLAISLLHAKWIRALDAFSKGDDASAINLFAELRALRTTYESELKVDGADHQHSPFRFLDQVPQILKDCQRRLGIAGTESGNPRGTILDQTDIDGLEDFGLPFGQTMPDVSPKIAASRQNLERLSKQGPVMMPQLIGCLGRDERLSRLVVKSHGEYRVVPVRELALRAVNKIATASFHADRNGRLPSAKTVQDWWDTNSNLRPGERVFRLLADDRGDAIQWVCAAKQISGLQSTFESMSPVERRWTQNMLKAHAHPSASELMNQRVNQLLVPGQSEILLKIMCECLWRWDQRASGDALKKVSDHLLASQRDREVSLYLQSNRSPNAGPGPFLSMRAQRFELVDPDLLPLLERRYSRGEVSVAPEYMSLVAVSCQEKNARLSTLLQFYYSHRTDPPFADMPRLLFKGTVPKNIGNILKSDPSYAPLAFRAMATPLMNLPELQDDVILMLRDKSSLGRVLNRNGTVVVEALGHPITRTMPRPGDTIPPVDGSWNYRVCDEVATRTVLHGKNDFQATWPEPKKDAAIARIIETLRSHPKKMYSDDAWWE